jgi:uncharacterized membrane protein
MGFFVSRAANLPGGDPVPWTAGRDALWSAMAFLNTDKYPPSPLYLAMTLGPLLMLLAAMDTAPDRPPLRWLGTFGRAPLFFYVAHLALLRAAGLAAAALVWGPAALGPPPAPSTPQWPLWAVWLIWALALAALYPPTRWYAGMRARRQRDRASSAP